MKKNKFGFTLTELLITIAIIAILAAITLPRYTQNEASRVSEAVSQLSAIRLGEEQYKTDHTDYLLCSGGAKPPCWSALDVDNPEQNPLGYFNYDVIAGPGPVFCAYATRRAGSNASGTTICIDNTGAYGGTHPNTPAPGSGSHPAGCVALGVAAC